MRLKELLAADPDGRGWAAMTDEQVLADVKVEDLPIDAGEIDPYLIDNEVPVAEREALRTNSPAFYDKWQAILNSQRPVDVKSQVMVDALDALTPAVFSAGTRTKIEALGTKLVSTEEKHGLGKVRLGHIMEARG